MNTGFWVSEKEEVWKVKPTSPKNLQNQEKYKMSKNITKDSLSEKVIIILAQMGIVGRRELSKVMYRQVGEEGDTERYGTVTTKQLSKAVQRIKDKGYVEAIKLEGQRKEDYLILTDKGWQYVDQRGLH